MAKESKVPLRVLLIESDDETSRLFQKVLFDSDQVDSRLTVAKSVEEGLRLVARTGFDVAVVDIDHDEAGGFVSLTQILARSPKVPIILLATPGDQDLPSIAHVLGADDYMAKDNLEPDVVGRILRYTVEREALRREQAECSNNTDSLLNAIPDVLLVVDASGRLLSWNHRLEELTARSVEDLGAASWVDLISVGPFAQHPAPGRIVEAALVRADGDRIPCLWTTTAFVREGRSSGSVFVGRDLRREREAASAAAELTRLRELSANPPVSGPLPTI